MSVFDAEFALQYLSCFWGYLLWLLEHGPFYIVASVVLEKSNSLLNKEVIFLFDGGFRVTPSLFQGAVIPFPIYTLK